MELFRKGIAGTLLVVHLVFGILVLYDLGHLAASFDEYQSVHGFTEDRPEWGQKSVLNYVLRDLSFLLVSVIVVWMSRTVLHARHRAFFGVLVAYSIALLCFLSSRLAQSAGLGFSNW